MNKTLKRKLDTVFSQYIRLRDSDINGYCKCISCGKIDHWSQMDNGHFVNRQHMSLRYSEVNCNAQCRKCNRFDEGNNVGYQKGLSVKYGNQTIEKLRLAKSRSVKITDFEAKAMIKFYTGEVKRMKGEKG